MMPVLKNIMLAAIIFAVGCSAPNTQIDRKIDSGPQQKTEGQNSELVKVTPCQLMNDPASYNHKLVEVTGFFSHGYEESSVTDPGCSFRNSIWLEYGGKSATGTMYCCGVTAEQSRPEQLVVEEISIPLVDDDEFRKFNESFQKEPNSTFRSTVVGRFFSGEQVKSEAGEFWIGYGHAGCCSLLALQQVLSVEPRDRDDMDYSLEPDSGFISNECGYEVLTPRWSGSASIEAQTRAELGERDWAFNDPQRVAKDALARSLKLDEKAITGVRQTRKAQGRSVYQWRYREQGTKYTVVVSRPYWLSFYAKDPGKVAWVVIATYEYRCS